MEQHEFDVAIIGAGPVGGALACRLAQAGQRVALVDRAALPPMEHPDFDGRAYAIARGSRPLLDQSGVWDALPIAPCPILDIRVTDGKPGRPASPLHLHFDHTEVGGEPFGWIVEARALRMALNEKLNTMPGLSLFAPAAASVTRHAGHADIAIAGGAQLRAKLVVAADGKHSQLRKEAGIATTTLPYRQSAVVCAIAHELPHDGVALEHFLPGGPFALLPMTGNAAHENISAIVFTEKTALAARLMTLDDAAFTAEIARRLGNHLGRIALVGKRWGYPLAAQYAQRYTATRLALVGDSAHVIHPIAGQGLNLGLRDAEALAGLVLATAGDPGAADLLARYQAARRPANMLMLAATDTLDRLFSNDNPVLRLARDVGIAAVHRMPRTRRFFMRAAMGEG